MFMDRGDNVVATSRNVSKAGFARWANLTLIDGDIGQEATAAKVTEAAISEFGSIDHVINNAGIFKSKAFTEYSVDDFRAFVSTNLKGFVFLTQRAVKQMLLQGNGGSVTSITTAMVDHPIGWVPASIVMITKGEFAAMTLSLASEYAKNNIRFNAVAPGQVDTPMHKQTPRIFHDEPVAHGHDFRSKGYCRGSRLPDRSSPRNRGNPRVDDGAHLGQW